MFSAVGVGEIFKDGKVFLLNGRCICPGLRGKTDHSQMLESGVQIKYSSSCIFVHCPTNDKLDSRPVASAVKSVGHCLIL